MTPHEINQAIEDTISGNDRWVLMKRGLYYRPNAKGYTDRLSEAWIVTEAEADKHTYPHDEPVTKHRATPRDFYNDLNACREMISALKPDQRDEFAEYLTGFWSESFCEFASTMEWLFAATQFTAPQFCEAVLRTVGRWREENL